MEDNSEITQQAQPQPEGRGCFSMLIALVGYSMAAISCLMVLAGLFPLLGALNWITIPAQFVSLTVCGILNMIERTTTNDSKIRSYVKVCLVGLAISLIRLLLGGGTF